jgi:hypothetical protein
VDLEGEEGGAHPAKRPISNLLEETAYTIGALAGNPRANAHYMELGKNTAARNLMCLCARIQLRSVRVDCIFKFSNNMIYAFVTCAPCKAPSSSCSLNRRTYTPKLRSTRMPRASLYLLHSSLISAPLARVILGALSSC